MGVYDELSKLDSESPFLQVVGAPVNNEVRTNKNSKTIANQSTSQSTNRQTDRFTDWLTDPIIDIDELGSVVDRPRAFYITQKVDMWLNEAVIYLRIKGMHKVDRSVLVNTILHNEGLYKPMFLNRIRKSLLAHLTNKSLKRVQSTD